MSVERKLNKLHELLANKLTEIVKKEDVSASELNVVRQFLKDNSIDSVPAEASPLHGLIEQLPEDFKRMYNKSN